MGLLSSAELGVSLPSLKAAEATVSSYLGSKVGLSERTVTQTGTFQGGVIPLRDGPATEVVSFNLNGYPMSPSVYPWHLDMGLGHVLPNPLMGGYGAGVYAVVYKAGWTLDNVPDAIREAVLMLAQQAETASAVPAGIVARQMGDVKIEYAEAGGTTLSPVVLALLLPYKALRF